MSFVYRRNTGIGVGGQYNNTLRGAYSAAPFVPIYSDNNIYDSPYNDTSNSDWNPEDGNPYGSMMTATNNENKNAFFAGNVYAELQPIKNLKSEQYLVPITIQTNIVVSHRCISSVHKVVIHVPV